MKKNIIALFIVFILAGLLFAVSGFFVGEKGNKQSVSIGKYYGIKNDRVKLFLDNEEREENGLVFEDRVYIDFALAKSMVTRLFYEEEDEQVIYTDPSHQEIYKLGSKKVIVNGKESEGEYSPFILKKDEVYVAVDFIKERFDLQYTLTEAPYRLLIYKEDKIYEKAEVTKDEVLRTEANIDSVFVSELSKGDEVWLLSKAETDDYEKVLTKDGIQGYVRKKALAVPETEEMKFERKSLDEAYTSLSQSEPIVLGWHQIFGERGNSELLNLLSETEGLNVISPTWFNIIREDGELSSFASKNYVDLAHERGIQVWALVNDFDKKVDFYELFMKEKNRRKLINNLVYFIKEFNLDGINIDFEMIKADYAEGFIQFLREFSIVMREMGKVLSVDNYVPAPHTDFYNRKEQGIVADYICVMAYDEHYYGSPEPGSVSSVSWVKRGVEMMGEEVAKEKMIIGLPFYTRIWKQTAEGKIETKALNMKEGFRRVSEAGKEPVWDEKTGQYYSEWKADGGVYKIWLEDRKSIGTKLNEVNKDELAGIAFWKLGLENANVWEMVKEWNQE